MTAGRDTLDKELGELPIDENDDPKLVARVDAMMNSKLTTAEPKPLAKKVKDESRTDGLVSAPPLDIFADATSAPILNSAPLAKVKKAHIIQERSSVSSGGEKITVRVKSAPTAALVAEAPENYDDPVTAQAINDIVASESDEVLAAEDSALAEQQLDSEPVKESGHKLFWSFIALICLVALALALFIIDPNLFKPLTKIHLNSIMRHL